MLDFSVLARTTRLRFFSRAYSSFQISAGFLERPFSEAVRASLSTLRREASSVVLIPSGSPVSESVASSLASEAFASVSQVSSWAPISGAAFSLAAGVFFRGGNSQAVLEMIVSARGKGREADTGILRSGSFEKVEDLGLRHENVASSNKTLDLTASVFFKLYPVIEIAGFDPVVALVPALDGHLALLRTFL